MKYRCFILFLTLGTSLACKNINPDKPSFNGNPVSLPKAVSKINIPLEIPLTYLEEHLNQGLGELLYSEEGLSMGNGLFTDIDVHRTGEISIAAKGANNISIRLPLRLKGNLKIEKKIFGQPISTSIPYDETLFPEISFSPEIGENWEVAMANLKVESWGRPMKFDLLGYEIDFDPILRKQIENMLNRQLGSNGLSKISFKSLMSKTWQAYGEPIKIGQGETEVFIYTVPHLIKVNDQLTANNTLKLNIGLEGEVMTQIGERPDKRASPLPPIQINEDTVNHIDVTLPLVVSYGTLDLYLNEQLVGKGIQLDKNTELIPKEIATQSFGERALVKIKFNMKREGKNDLKGELFLVGKPLFDRDQEAIVFHDIEFDLNTKNILAKSASWLKQEQLLTAIKKQAVYPIGPYIQEAKSELQQLGYISTDFASFSVKNTELDVKDIFVTEDDIRLYLDASGEMDVKLKDADKVLE